MEGTKPRKENKTKKPLEWVGGKKACRLRYDDVADQALMYHAVQYSFTVFVNFGSLQRWLQGGTSLFFESRFMITLS